jgi:diguanylate cyclase (GGDEF)-like protein/PAS domain S-box-containing protein
MTTKLKKTSLFSRIQLRILMPFVLSFLLIITLSVFGVNYLQKANETTFLHAEKNQITNSFVNSINQDSELQHGLIELIKTNKEIQQAWLSRDFQLLTNLSEPIFEKLKSNHKITHFYFHNTDKTNFLRAHRKQQRGDLIKRYTLEKAYQTGRPYSGLEFGEKGLFVLRVVHPWYINQELIGYIELGKEINHLIDKVAEINNSHLALIIDKGFLNNIKSKSNTPLQKVLAENNFENKPFVIYSSAFDLKKIIDDSGIDYKEIEEKYSKRFQSGNKDYYASTFSIKNTEGKNVGQMLFSIDISELQKKKYELLKIIFSIIFIVALIIVTFYFRYSRRLQNYLSDIYSQLELEISAHEETEIKLEEYTKELEVTVEERTRELVVTNDELKKDIELRKKTEQEFKNSEKKYRVLFEKTPDAILIIDNNEFVDCNDATVKMLRYKNKKELLMTHPSVLSPPTQPDGRESWEKAEAMISIAFKNGSHRFEWEHKRADGEVFPVEVLLTSIPVGDRNILYTVWRDITERKRDEKTIKHQAYYDSLTNLPNRSLLRDRLQQAIIHSNRYKNNGAVLYLDLDQFKKINDSLGHSVGDSLLIEVSNRIECLLREGDTAARLGGDEFIILLPELQSNESSYTYAEKVANKIKLAINEPFHIDQYELKVSTSIGISVFTGKNESVDDVLQHADTAMYRAKSDGRNSIRFFLPSMQAEVVKRLNLEQDLSDALDNEELYMCYQPQYSEDHKLFGVEALIRWEHPERGNISPLDFIPIAEDMGLIIPIGNWVLGRAMSDIRSLTNEMSINPPLNLSINLSPHQFSQEDFILNIKSSIVENNFPANYLTLEITENVIIHNIEDTIKKCQLLNESGINISLDDFGTGYSSLGHLKQLPINELKIDRSFIRDIEIDKNDAILVETIISMAHHFDLKIVAEGVETLEQLNFLRNHGCNAYQGYYFSKPLIIEELRDYYIKSEQNEKSA